MNLHVQLLENGNVDGAISAALESLDLETIRFLGLVHHFRKQDRKTAIVFYQFGLEVSRMKEDAIMEGLFCISLGSTFRVLGQFEEADPYLERAYSIGQETFCLDVLLQATGQRALWLEQTGGALETVYQLYADALPVARSSTGGKGPLVDLLVNGAKTLTALGRLDEGLALFNEAQDLIPQLQESEDPIFKEMWYVIRFGELLVRFGATDQAQAQLRRGLELAKAREQADAIAAAEAALATLNAE